MCKTPKEWRYETAHDAVVDVYSVGIGSGISLRYEWPFKLVHAGHVSQDIDLARQTKRTCDTLMLDSGIQNPDITNEEVLDAAYRCDADYVIPKDYICVPDDKDHANTPEEARRLTTESVHEFLDIYPDHKCDATYLIPLQPPHDTHYREGGFEDEDRFLVGGVKNKDPDEQLQYLNILRSVVGDDAYIHGLGMGGSRTLVDAFRSDPTLVDSVDTSTPEFAPARHRTPDMSLQQKTGGFELPHGDGTSTVKAVASELILLQITHMLNPDWEPKIDHAQSGIDAFI